MADESTSLPIPRTIDPRSVPDPSKLNLYQLPEQEATNYSDATEKAIRALEDRYAQPNWFKVAAGFAKPQLGGFAASLGSAAGALGDWQEQQKAIAPTVAAMQANLGMQRAVLGQNKAQATMWQDFLNSPPKDPNEALRRATDIATRNPDSAVGKQASAWVTQNQTATSTTGQKLKQSIEAQQTATENPLIKIDKGYLPEDWSTGRDKTRQDLEASLISSGKFTPEGVKLMADKDLLDSHLGLQKTYAEMKIKDARNSGEVIRANADQLQDLGVARDLATSPRMEKMLGLGSGQNAVSALFGYFAEPTDSGKIGALNSAVAKLAQDNPQAYADFEVLRKVLNKNLADARSAIQNPSVGAQNLLAATTPSPLNTQLGIVKMLDLIAHEKSGQIREGVLRQQFKGDPTRFETDVNSGYGNLHDKMQGERIDIARKDSNNMARVPLFYNPYSSILDIQHPQAKPEAGAAPAEPAPNKTYERPKTRNLGDKIWDLQPDGSYKRRG